MEYFIKCEIGAGMFSTEVIEATSLEEAEGYARSACIDLAESYDYYQDEDYFGELDSVGRDWVEEEECYNGEAFMEYYAVEYDPEQHDGELY